MKLSILPLVLVFLAGAAFSLSAQSNETIDLILSRDVARTGEALYMALLATGLATDAESQEDVYNRIGRDWARWGLSPRAANAPILFGEYAFVLMQVFEMPGGVMYRLMPGPRYAAREIVYQGLASGSQAADRTISGEEMLRILANVRIWQQEQQL